MDLRGAAVGATVLKEARRVGTRTFGAGRKGSDGIHTNKNSIILYHARTVGIDRCDIRAWFEFPWVDRESVTVPVILTLENSTYPT